MKVIYGLNHLKSLKNKSVVTIGIFDGMHRGHTHIFRQLTKTSSKLKALSVCLTFWPHPKKSPFIYSLEHRLNLISEFNLDLCIVIRFTKFIANMQPEQFVKNVLIDRLNMAALVVGSNFRFGRQARANINTLRRLSKIYGFFIKEVKPLKIGKSIISSTEIRRYITQGKLKQASKLLGRNTSVYGRVKKGWRLGRMLGYPTANINPHYEVLPPTGVYAVVVKFHDKCFFGACYIGYRPTIQYSDTLSIEVHILDFYHRIYGKDLYIEFFKKIRPDKKFASKQNLIQQIQRDIIYINKFFGTHTIPNL